MVDPVNNVLQFTFPWRCQQDSSGALTLQMPVQACGVTPLSRVVDNEGVVDPVSGVIDVGWVVRIDHLDYCAVGQDLILLGVDRDCALEGAVHGVSPQEAGALNEVLIGTAANHNRTQPQTAAAT